MDHMRATGMAIVCRERHEDREAGEPYQVGKDYRLVQRELLLCRCYEGGNSNGILEVSGFPTKSTRLNIKRYPNTETTDIWIRGAISQRQSVPARRSSKIAPWRREMTVYAPSGRSWPPESINFERICLASSDESQGKVDPQLSEEQATGLSNIKPPRTRRDIFAINDEGDGLKNENKGVIDMDIIGEYVEVFSSLRVESIQSFESDRQGDPTPASRGDIIRRHHLHITYEVQANESAGHFRRAAARRDDPTADTQDGDKHGQDVARLGRLVGSRSSRLTDRQDPLSDDSAHTAQAARRARNQGGPADLKDVHARARPPRSAAGTAGAPAGNPRHPDAVRTRHLRRHLARRRIPADGVHDAHGLRGAAGLGEEDEGMGGATPGGRDVENGGGRMMSQCWREWQGKGRREVGDSAKRDADDVIPERTAGAARHRDEDG
ncbi:hypothetical protein DFH09DRAFT_1082046 [Mycena vulgaris]|nr:hypothetical protein DFH09DRAFT_1082046 [Mycena vulgaris]